MKLHLPKLLRFALLAAVTACTSLGTFAADSVTYNDLTSVIKDTDHNVYYNGQGTFYVDSSKTTTLQVTIDLANLKAYQHSNDYSTVCNGVSSFVTWSYNNKNSWGLADYWKNPQQELEYEGYGSEARLTGYWSGNAWNQTTEPAGNNIYYSTIDTLSQYAINDQLTMTITNNPVSGGGITATCAGKDGQVVTLYCGTGLYDSTVAKTSSYTVNLNYVTAVTLETPSTLDISTFKEPVDSSQPYHSERWDAQDESSLGRVLFAGDSITHGVQDMTWRWQMFKTFQDNGIENEIAGPRSGYDLAPNTSDYQGSTTTYNGVEFNNVHLANSSGRTHNIVTGAYPLGSGKNYGGWSTAKTAAAYDADTIVCLMGTNDILSDGGDYRNKFAIMLGGSVSYENDKYVWSQQGTADNQFDPWGTFGKMVGDLSNQERDTVYIMSVPCWTSHANSNPETYHQAAMQFNTLLEEWTKQYGKEKNKNVVFVDVNKGLIDPTATTSFFGNAAFFRDPGTAQGKDGLHPNEQGSIIIAGNLARGMGLAGRTANLTRSGVGHENHGWNITDTLITLAGTESRQVVTDAFTTDGGYTIDFAAVFGDGAANGWLDKNSGLSVTIGDGTNSGTLKLTEGYIMWGDTVLFCQDNHLADNENIRVAYHQGNQEANIGSGYYVWLDDMLIGQALTASTGSSFNGVTLSSVGGKAAISGFAYTDTAYAPSTTLITANDKGLAPAILTPSLGHDNPTKVASGVTWSSGNSGTNSYTVNSNSATSGNQVYTTTLANASGSWIAAKGGAGKHTGDLSLQLGAGSKGCATVFGLVNSGDVTGNVTVELNSADATIDKFTSTNPASIVGGYNWKNAGTQGSIEGTFKAVVNAGTLSYGIIGGYHTTYGDNNHIGSVDLVINGGSVGGNVYGGSIAAAATVGTGVNSHGHAIDITVTGGSINGDIVGSGTAGKVNGDIAITVTGGIINGDISGWHNGVTRKEDAQATITVEGNKALISGNIKADVVKLKDVEYSGHSDGFDRYSGTITADTVELDNYTAGEVKATIHADTLSVTNGTETALSAARTTMKSLSAAGGSISLQNLSEETGLSLKDLVIGQSRAVTALTSGTTIAANESNVGAVVVTGKLNAASGAVLNANLTMATGSTLQVAAGGLEMGCSLTLEKGINLGDDQLTTLTTKGSLTLFTGVDSLTLADGISGTTEAITMEQGISAGTYFNLPSTLDAATADPYVLVYSGAADGGVLSLALATPEPATATLSLLALAGLAARRRRK